jgi:hypothetical protein
MTFTTVLNFILLTAVATNLVMCLLNIRQMTRYYRLNRMLLTLCTGAYRHRPLRPQLLKVMMEQKKIVMLPIPPRDD